MAPRLPSSCVKLSLASSPHRAASSAVSAGSFFRRRANRPPPFFLRRALYVLAVRGHRGGKKGAELVVHLAEQRALAHRGGRGRCRGRRFHRLFARGRRGLAGLLAHVRGQRVLHGELRRIVDGVRGLAPGLFHPAHALGLCGAQLFLALGLLAPAHLKAGLLQHALALGLFFLILYHCIRFCSGQLHCGGLLLRLRLRLLRRLRCGRLLLPFPRLFPLRRAGLPGRRLRALLRRLCGRCGRGGGRRLFGHGAWQKDRLGITRALPLAQPHAF